jgi:hypothetical protein
MRRSVRLIFAIVTSAVAVLSVASTSRAALLPMSDEFNNTATLANWSQIHQTEGWNASQLQVLDINATQPGRMVMQPHAVTWYQNYRGPLTYKTIGGNFSLATQVEVRNGANQSIAPASTYSLAGAMLRVPRSITDPATQWTAGGEDYCFLSLGHGNGAPGPQFEVKTTDNSSSVLELTPAAGLTATVQLSRVTNNVGTFVIAMLQQGNSAWQVHRRYRRDDMAGTLQAGLVTYSDYATVSSIQPFDHNSNTLAPGHPLLNGATPHPDLIGGFEYARYYDLGNVPAALANVNLLDTAAASDAALVAWLTPVYAAGDFDGDGDVDGADFVAWQTNFPLASGATLAQGDADGDGDVDGADFVVWQTNFPTSPAPGSVSVPEPSGVWLIAFAVIGLVALRFNADGIAAIRRCCFDHLASLSLHSSFAARGDLSMFADSR